MRLIGQFQTEKEAYQFYSFLLKERIKNTYELFQDPVHKTPLYQVWIYNEEDLSVALEWYQKYLSNPTDPLFQAVDSFFIAHPSLSKSEPPSSTSETPSPKKGKIKINLQPKLEKTHFTFSNFLLILCVLLFLWNGYQERILLNEKGEIAAEIGITPLHKKLLFDFPCSFKLLEAWVNTYITKEMGTINDIPEEAQKKLRDIEEYPDWKGFYYMALNWKKTGWSYFKSVPRFEDIKKGEIWRLFTPCLLHRDLLHILFNLAWLWVLGKQIEDRLGKWRFVLFVLTVGIISNFAEYWMGGPSFLGLSGVIVGMVGFIWMRQRIAPWEGYPLHRGTILFLAVFVAAMVLLELVSFLLQIFSVTNFSANIGNTAHIVGGLIGILLGRIPLFSRGAS